MIENGISGIGMHVQRAVLAEPWVGPTGLNVPRGRPARRIHERNGFVTDTDVNVDVFVTYVESR